MCWSSSLSESVHSFMYSSMKLYRQVPLANPAKHVHRYACIEIVPLIIESAHVALFWHGLLEHSSTSISQLPAPSVQASLLSVTEQLAAYSEMKSYSHLPLVKPATHVHR